MGACVAAGRPQRRHARRRSEPRTSRAAIRGLSQPLARRRQRRAAHQSGRRRGRWWSSPAPAANEWPPAPRGPRSAVRVYHPRHMAKTHAAFAALFLALAVLMTWPLAPNISRAVTDPGDPFINTW